jgi:hypothetical protein
MMNDIQQIENNQMQNLNDSSLVQVMDAAYSWAKQLFCDYYPKGRLLDQTETGLAILMGVEHPENIRILEVNDIPEPSDNCLVELRRYSGLLHSHSLGLSVRYLVFIRSGSIGRHILAHEFRHVYQYEKIGSLQKMIHQYLVEIIHFGYQNAPLEIDAVNTSKNID